MIHGIFDSWLDPSFVYEMVEIFVPLNSSLLPSIFEFMHVICWRFETMFWYHAYPRNVDLTKWIMNFLLSSKGEVYIITFCLLMTWSKICTKKQERQKSILKLIYGKPLIQLIENLSIRCSSIWTSHSNRLIGFNLAWKLQSFRYSLMAHLLVFLGARMASDKVIHSLRISLLLRWKDLAVCWNTQS